MSEKHLLSGRADLAIECGRPIDPLIRFQLLLDEPFSVVATAQFIKRNKIRDRESLLASPHVGYERDPASQLLGLDSNSIHMVARFGDISSTRGACLASVGWAVLPNYSTKSWIASRHLMKISYIEPTSRKFGVWWHRDRRAIRPTVDAFIQWMKKQDLS
jgi:DNA-binding transcriptional LysR family regulator